MEWKTEINISEDVKRFVEQIEHNPSKHFSLGAQYFPNGSTVRYSYMPSSTFLKSIELMDQAQEKESKSQRIYCGKNNHGVTFTIYQYKETQIDG